METSLWTCDTSGPKKTFSNKKNVNIDVSKLCFQVNFYRKSGTWFPNWFCCTFIEAKMQNKIAKIILSITSDKRHIPIEIIGTTQKSIFSHFIIFASKQINLFCSTVRFYLLQKWRVTNGINLCVGVCLGLRRWIEIGISGRIEGNYKSFLNLQHRKEILPG